MLLSRLKKILIIALLSLTLPTSGIALTKGEPDDQAARAKLLSYILRDQLSRHHYSSKPIDDELSRAAFALYLKQLDSQKRFLLQADVTQLNAYATRIDDEINSGRIELPKLGARLLDERVDKARKIVRELLSADFDFSVQEYIETDPDKLEFCANEQQLRERWRQSLKYQVLSRYLDMLEEEEKKATTAKGQPTEVSQEKARGRVLKSYEELFERMLSEKAATHLDRYFNAVTRAFDPHTNYMPPTQKEDFDISMRGSLEGIGATLKEEDGFIKVVTIIPGSPAAREGRLQADDVILKVAEGAAEPVDITDTRIRDAVSLIRGPKGSEVRLSVRKPDGSKLVVPIIRDVVQIEETFVKGTILRDEQSGKTFGYIKIPSFYRDFAETRHGGSGRNSTDDLRAELKKLTDQKIEGLVLDLRNNGGGALTDAVGIAGLFIETGPVVQVRNNNGKVHVLRDDDPAIDYDGPLVVLVNQFSASASEILAGALQDYGRAVIIGSEHTHGKGTVQAMVDLDRNAMLPNMERFKPLGALKMTIQKFYRVSGDSTQYRGVIPDIVLPDRMQHLKSGEQYNEHSLPWDSIRGTRYTRWPLNATEMAAVREASQRRTKGNEDFSSIRKDAQLSQERSERTRQPLQLEEVRRERAELRQMDQRARAHGQMPLDDDSAAAERDSDRDWIKKLGEDPYAGEALAVLNDLLRSRAPLQASQEQSRKRQALPH
jgi:carboxyl-terminal processing protease